MSVAHFRAMSTFCKDNCVRCIHSSLARSCTLNIRDFPSIRLLIPFPSEKGNHDRSWVDASVHISMTKDISIQ